MALLARGERVSGRNGALGRPFLSFSFSLLSCLDGLSFPWRLTGLVGIAGLGVGWCVAHLLHAWWRYRSLLYFTTLTLLSGGCEIFLEVASRGCEIDGVEVVG